MQMPNIPYLPEWMGGAPDEEETPTVAQTVLPNAAPMILTKRMACYIGEGSLLIGEEWYEYDPITLTLDQGQEKIFYFVPHTTNKRIAMKALYGKSGQRVAICPAQVQPGTRTVRCEHIYALEDDFERGIQRTLDIPPYLGNGKITCQTMR